MSFERVQSSTAMPRIRLPKANIMTVNQCFETSSSAKEMASDTLSLNLSRHALDYSGIAPSCSRISPTKSVSKDTSAPLATDLSR